MKAFHTLTSYLKSLGNLLNHELIQTAKTLAIVF